ncbi:hypothetical protein SAMN04515654_12159 [Halanaerobium congolense]|uniref:Uncharacterized protein n=1 Tax=Halanaerobium congolense TaxID=54121 RepID=A0A1G8PWZ3_9FIRM|nr:hypothetical protein [Halanaerobium congolense]SDI97002.1 hypothetical protein SAMN04515654_12159 [Halanaerobium congolense]SES91818.1 hypothetical protein SAMN04515653_10459 [Halanaerobium congolense]
MQNILIDMFKEFNQKSKVIYFVDLVAGEVKYSKPDSECEKICAIDEVKQATLENGIISLDADKQWNLTIEGPKL